VRAKAGLTIIAATVLAATSASIAHAPRPQTILQGPDVGDYSLVASSAGERVVVVRRDVSPNPRGLDVFTAPPGARFGRATKLRGDRLPDEPSAAFAPDGTLAIVGPHQRPGKSSSGPLTAIVRSPDGRFGKLKAISRRNVYDASIAFDRQGTAMAIWTRDSTKTLASWVEMSTRPPGGAWSKPAVISYERRGANSPQVAFDATGGAVAAWVRSGSPIEAEFLRGARPKRRHFEDEVVTATRTPGGTFSHPQRNSDPRFNSSEPSLSVNSAGQAALAWVLNTKDDEHFRIGAAFREPGRRFGPPRFLTPDGRDSFGASIALDEQGRALLVWAITGAHRNMTNRVLGAIRPPGGPLGTPIKLSDRYADFPATAATPDGRAVVMWVRHSRNGDLVQARRFTTSGALGPVTQLSRRGYFDELLASVDDSGAAVATWRGGGGNHERIQAGALAP
jgi:hypothetical protein